MENCHEGKLQNSSLCGRMYALDITISETLMVQ